MLHCFLVIFRHQNTISLQIEVTTFLNRALGKHSLVPPAPPTQQVKTPPTSTSASLARRTSDVGGGAPVSSLPTLFGNTMEKAEVVHKVGDMCHANVHVIMYNTFS